MQFVKIEFYKEYYNFYIAFKYTHAMSKSQLVLAFDIERSGGTDLYDTIALGACVMNDKFEELDRYFYKCYIPTKTVFEKRCYDQFWSKHQDTLTSLEYKGDASKETLEHEMIKEFHDFRKKYETYAEDNGYEFYLVTDNNVYDGGFVNDLIFKYMPHTLPIPYTAKKQEYETFFETHSIEKGILLANGISKDWGLFDEIKNLYNVPKCKCFHDHNPANDAYTIAYEMHTLLQIGNCKIGKK